MSENLKSSARKVQDCLSSQGYDFVVKEFSSSTRTAQDAAESIGCAVHQIAKSLIFKDKRSGLPILVIASGSNRVDTKKIKNALGNPISRADADFVRENTGFAIGGIPPVAHKTKLQTFLDEDLKSQEVIWAAAGTPNSLFELTPTTLEKLTGGYWLDLAD
ncbi:YbaK/EbsC family protein [Vibrio sp. YIC-376]|uniref:YbaK/EbsC family protein n=1 Tax=Vibrio sp. YIC-376 TaxID=3136162 RepID=UPI00402A6256